MHLDHGKSTLLHLIAGVDIPTEGEIIVDSISLSNLSDEKLANYRRSKVGLIYQFYNLVPVLNAKDNMELPVLLNHEKIDKEKENELIEMLQLQNRLYSYPSQLSGGEQQRVAIARALLAKPAVLLADEPTGNLDSKNSEEVIKLLKDYHQKYGQTVIIVTHDENIAKQAKREIQLQDGKIIADRRNEK